LYVALGAARPLSQVRTKVARVPTYSPKASEIQRAWYVVDADGLILGRLATEVARVLRGKHKPSFTPHLDTGDHVVIVNADKVVLTAGKAERKTIYRHSGYPGGLKAETFAHLLERRPEEAVRRTIRGMLPKTRLAGRHDMATPLAQTTGRRKGAVARVRIRPGTGTITINDRDVATYFPSKAHRMILSEPLRVAEAEEAYDIDASLVGGGVSGQAGALRLGIARALVELDPELRTTLKRAGFLSRDQREKESKKYGLKKARKAPQYSKR
jgi:ribosomal protein L13